MNQHMTHFFYQASIHLLMFFLEFRREHIRGFTYYFYQFCETIKDKLIAL